jgi:peptide/nickel transport system substrate-binding protein
MPTMGAVPEQRRERRVRRLTVRATAVCGAAALALVVAACSSGSSGTSSSPSSSVSPGSTTSSSNPAAAGLSTNGDTATWAEVPGFTPNWIFPFTSPAAYGTWNLDDMQELMYRPLYWFGNGQSPTINYPLSLAGAPVWSANSKSLTITLKPYKWNNGETVDATDVVFWMNMYKAEEDNFGGYVPGDIPDNVTSVKALSPTEVQFNLTIAANHNWFLYNELPQITPMPDAWDVTSLTAKAGSGGCATDSATDKWAKCVAVYNFLIAQNRDLTTYATSPIWGVVDGPWKLSAFNSDGAFTMVQNPDYSGQATIPEGTAKEIKEFKSVPFTSDAAEYDALKSGTGTVQVGYLPPEDITGDTSNPSVAGPNPLSPDFDLDPWIIYSVDYFPINFNNPTVGPIFKQLYFRQALQYTIPTQAIIKNVFHGYAYQTTNGVPTLPSSSLLAPGLANDQFPFSISNAKALLTAHGWNVSTDPGTCAKPGTGAGECGAGITAGEKLSFDLKFPSGTAFLTTEFDALQSEAGLAGIQLNLSEQAGQEITANDVSCTPSKATPCTWEMGSWGSGWVYAPDYYPSGEDLFLTGSFANYGSYSDPTNDALIKQTLSPSGTTQTMYTWEKYIASQVPVVWMPDYANPITEIAANLQGVTPLNTFDYINPEDWYYSN